MRSKDNRKKECHIKTKLRAATTYETAGLILHRIRARDASYGPLVPPELSLLGVLPEDDDIRNAEIEGKSLLSVSIPALEDGIGRILGGLGIS